MKINSHKENKGNIEDMEEKIPDGKHKDYSKHQMGYFIGGYSKSNFKVCKTCGEKYMGGTNSKYCIDCKIIK